MTAPVLDRLRDSLRGPRRAREDMLAEIRDGLEDATDAYRSAGLPPATARERAEADFGDPDEVAAELQEEMTARYGLRSALLMAVILAGLTLMWDAIWVFESANEVHPGPLVPLLSSLIDTTSLVTAASCAVALALLATGIRVSPRWTVRALGWAVMACLALIAAATIAMHLTGVPDIPAVAPMVMGASCVSAAMAVWLAVRAVRCVRLAGNFR